MPYDRIFSAYWKNTLEVNPVTRTFNFFELMSSRLLSHLHFPINSVHTRCIVRQAVLQGAFVKIGDLLNLKVF